MLVINELDTVVLDYRDRDGANRLTADSHRRYKIQE